MADLPPYPGMPRWVKISLVAAGLLVLLIVIAIIAGAGPGGHGPGRHFSSAGGGAEAPPGDAEDPPGSKARADGDPHSEGRH